MDYYRKNTENYEERVEQLTEKFNEFKKSMEESKIDEAINYYDEVFQLSTHLNIEPDIIEEATRILGDYIKKSGIYKKQIMMEKLCELDLYLKILIAREINSDFASGFSIDALFTAPIYEGDKLLGREKWIKKELPYPMALGLNKNGKLGIGTEENTEEFRRIQVEGNIDIAFIGDEHSIICTNDGKYYGAGRSGNFIVDDITGNSIIPVELNYIKHNPADWASTLKVPHCYLERNKTVFYHFRPRGTHSEDEYLVVERNEGVRTTWRMGQIGDSFWLGCRLLKQDPAHPIHKKTITVNNLSGHPTILLINSRLFDEVFPTNIVWFVCGARTESITEYWIRSPDFGGNVYFGDDGIVWIHHQKTLYRGEVVLAPRMIKKSKKNLSVDEMEEILVVNMEEVYLPYAVHGFTVSPDGKSIMIWPSPPKITETTASNVIQYNLNKVLNSAENPDLILQVLQTWLKCRPAKDLEEVYNEFRIYLTEKWCGTLYEYTGFPSVWGNYLVPVLEEISRFVEITDDTEELPYGLFKFLEQKNNNLPIEWKINCTKLYYDFQRFVVQTGWADEMRDERIEQIGEMENEKVTKLLDDIDKALGSLVNIPLKYIQNDMVKEFKDKLNIIMHYCFSILDPWLTNSCNKTVIENFKQPCLEVKKAANAVLERMRLNDIDVNDQRFLLVRVEAVTYTIKGSVFTHCPYVVYTTCQHVCLVDSRLLDFIKDGVLNINQKFNFSLAASEFLELMDAFFGILPENIYETCINGLRQRLNPIDSGMVDYYFITTNDKEICKVPKILLQVYSSGYNASRTRGAERNGEDPDNFEMNISKENLELLMKALLDSRELRDCDVNQLSELLDFCRYALIDVLQNDIIRRIVQKVEESNSKCLQDLFFYHPKETIDFVAKHRPEIILSWKEFPMQRNYLKILEEIAKKIHHFHFKFYSEPTDEFLSNRELPLSKDDNVSHVDRKIEQSWLEKFLLNGKNDDDVKRYFNKSMMIWDGMCVASTSNIRRRNRS